MPRHALTALFLAALSIALLAPAGAAAPLDDGILRVVTYNSWQAFEVITQGDNPPGDGVAYTMPGTFDGAGAWQVDADTLRLLVNHETSDASISEVDVDLAALRASIDGMVASGSTGGAGFVAAARQAYDRWSPNGGASWVATSDASTTSFGRFCSAQSYAPHTFGTDRGFVDELYITGEEIDFGRLFVLDSVARDLYQLSGVTGSAPGGIGGVAFDKWENAALIDTGETDHIALMLSPDGGSQRMQIYIGEKNKDASGAPSTSLLARNGLAYGSWYYLNAFYPLLGVTNPGSFDTTEPGALFSSKLEDIDTSPGDPTRVVLGDQNSGVFSFDFALVFNPGFDAGASSFALTKISNENGSTNSLDGPDNVDWTAPTTLGANDYPEGLIFLNEDTDDGEVWQMEPDGSNQIRIASTTVGEESSGIFDLSGFVGYLPGSVLITNGQGLPSSMSVLIHPDAALEPEPVAGFSDEGCALAGALGAPLLAGSGDLSAGSANVVTLSDAAPSASAGLFVAFSSTPTPFKAGTLKPVPWALFKLLTTDGAGEITIPFVGPAGVPANTELWIQYAITDAGAPLGVALSNALKGTIL